MEKSIKMVEEITQQRKMTENVKSNLRNEIWKNVVSAGIIIISNLVINVIYLKCDVDTTKILLKIFSIISIFLTVIIFECAYKKDSVKISILGIEVFVFSFFVLYVPQMYEHLYKIKKIIFLFFPAFCVLYYSIKSTLIYKKTKFNYQNNLSDVKEIMKDD